VADVIDDGGRSAAAGDGAAVAADGATATDEQASDAPTQEMPAVIVDDEDAEPVAATAPPLDAPPTEPGLGPPPPPSDAADAAPPANGPFPPADPGSPREDEEEDARDVAAEDLPFGRGTTDLYEDLDTAGGRHKALTALITVVVLAVVLGGAYFGGSWYANRTYFLSTEGGQVVIYRGQPGGFLIFDPSIEQRFDVGPEDLEDDVAADVVAEREFGSLANARSFVNNGQAREEPTETTTTTKTTTTTEARTTTTTEAGGSTTAADEVENVPSTTAGP